MSLLLGLISACAWALHDICVRHVSQKTRILHALLTVLIVGTILMSPVAAYRGDWAAMTLSAYSLCALSGLAFSLASLSLYGAFAIGPVRLVAPIIGTYPVLSVGWSVIVGSPVTGLQWIAVLVVVVGVALVAALSDSAESHGQIMPAVILSLLAGGGFALTFAAGQAAARIGTELPVILSSRVVAAATIGIILIARKQRYRIDRTVLPLLAAMGLLDATALACVTAAGTLPHPEFAAVASSLFGMLTVVLAWAILKEPMSRAQWSAVVMVFCGIGYLGI